MWSFDFLKQMGYVQLPDKAIAFRNNMHTDLHYEAIMAVADPELVRAQARFMKGKYEVHEVEIKSESELVELGKKLAEYRVEITVRAIRDAVAP